MAFTPTPNQTMASCISLSSSIPLAASSFLPSFPKTHRVSRFKKPNRHNIPIVSCKSGKNDHEQNPATRRDLLIGLGGLYGASSLSDPFAMLTPLHPQT